MLDFIKTIWNNGVSNKLMLIGSALMLMVITSTLIYAIWVRPGDVSFLKRDGHSLRWDRSSFPLSCIYDAEALPDRQRQAYERVRRKIALTVADGLLGPCVEWQLPDKFPDHIPNGIILKPRYDGDALHGAITEHRFDKRSGKILSSVVSVDVGFDENTLDLVYLHELGHVLGLDHDREKSSIMFKNLGMRPDKFSNRDRDTLRKAYLE